MFKQDLDSDHKQHFRWNIVSNINVIFYKLSVALTALIITREIFTKNNLTIKSNLLSERLWFDQKNCNSKDDNTKVFDNICYFNTPVNELHNES